MKKVTTKSTKTITPAIPVIRGYKVFNPDFTAKEGGFQYAENTEFKHEGPIKICRSGFHFCVKASHCFTYYSFDPANIVCEVESRGTTDTHDDDSKVCTDLLFVGRRLTWEEVLTVSNEGKGNSGHSNSGDRNSGYWNSGDRNSGNWNSGNWNSGDRNSGDSNSGYRNSGNWNSGDRNSGDSNSGYRNSGAFCTDANPPLLLFNKVSKMTVREWEQHPACQLMYKIDPNIWVPFSMMTDEEKASNPKGETTEGYLKSIPMKQAWADFWHNLADDKRKLFLELEGFDAAIFTEITGIKI